MDDHMIGPFVKELVVGESVLALVVGKVAGSPVTFSGLNDLIWITLSQDKWAITGTGFRFFPDCLIGCPG